MAAGTAKHHAKDKASGSPALDHTRGVASTAAVGGHPIHPALVVLPIAFLVGAFGADAGFWWTGDAFWARAALWLTGVGVAAGLVAATAGAVDFVTIERARVHRVGWIHALGNSAVLILAAASWLLRLGDPAAAVMPWGIVLSATTAALLGVTGWAGGELVFRHMIGVTGHGGNHDSAGEQHGAKHDSAGEQHGGKHTGEHPAGDSSGAQMKMDKGAGAHRAGPGMKMAPPPTGAQLAAVTALTLLALAGGTLYAAYSVNLTIGAREVGGAVMPPGMIATRQTTADAMRDMAAIDTRKVAYTAPADARGDQPLAPRLEDGVKVFDLETSVIRWNILPDRRVSAYAYNRQVPGPRIRVTEGDRVRINVTNNLPEPTTVHWHGLILPNAMDGPAGITQRAIAPGETFSYEFTLTQRGTFFYHSHARADRQQALGLYGALIVDPRKPAAVRAYDRELVVQLQEWLHRDGYTFPAMPMDGAMPNFFTINGKAYPATETVRMKVGERLLIRFIGSSSAFVHPMHVHGGPFRIVEADGYPVPEGAQIEKDTVSVAPGERYDVIWPARVPGKWLLHCHINHHLTNDNREEQGAGGLTLLIDVSA